MFQTDNTLNKSPQNDSTYLRRYTTHLTPTLHSLLGWNTMCKSQPCQCSCVGHYWHKDTVRVQGSKAECGVLTSCTHYMVCTTWQHTMQSTSCTHHMLCTTWQHTMQSTSCTHHMLCTTWQHTMQSTSCTNHKHTDNTPCNQLPVHTTWCAPPDNTPGSNFL